MENYSIRGAYSSGNSRRGGGGGGSCGNKFERHWPGGPRQSSWPPGRVAKQPAAPRILRQRRANSYSSDPLNLRWVAQESLRRELAGESPMPGDSALNSPVLPPPAQPSAAATVPGSSALAAAPSSMSWRLRRSSAGETLASSAGPAAAAASAAMLYGRQRSLSFKRPPRFVPVYGNYRACRHGGGLNMDRMQDDRLQLLQPDWYTDKEVLDIGCNDGVFSLKIAESLRVRGLTGVDIDPHLVRVAQGNLRRKRQEEEEEARLRQQLASEGYHQPAEAASAAVTDAAAAAAGVAAEAAEPTAAAAPPQSGSRRFPHNVTFVVGNYVLDGEEQQLAQAEENKYDIIQAFSITKWIHLNWGDRGLKLFFRRAFKELKPDGKFIVEPQPYHSYRRHLLCPEHKRNYACNIALKPERFRAYLEQEVGFAHILSISEQQQCHGFQRPVLMCSKPTGYTPAPTVQLHSGQLHQQLVLHQQQQQQQQHQHHQPLPRPQSAERLFMDYMAAVSSTTLDTPQSIRLPPASPASAAALWEDVEEEEADNDEEEEEEEADAGVDEAAAAIVDAGVEAMELPVQVG